MYVLSISGSTIAEYYAGTKTTNDKRSIIIYTRILSNKRFYKTKQYTRFSEWLAKNRELVPPTTLSSSSHVRVGWLVRSYPTYSNFNKATTDLVKRIGQAIE